MMKKIIKKKDIINIALVYLLLRTLIDFKRCYSSYVNNWARISLGFNSYSEGMLELIIILPTLILISIVAIYFNEKINKKW